MKHGLAVIFVIAGAAGTAGCTGKYLRPTTDEVVERTEARVNRGQYLVDNAAACGACHTGRPSGDLLEGESTELYLAGGNTFEEESLGAKLWVPNLTPDEETGIGSWTDDELMRGIRDGVTREGKFMAPFMPYGAYQHMSDEDVRSVVAYLRTLPAVKAARPRFERELSFVMGFAINRGFLAHLPAQNVPQPDRSNAVAYGEYVAELGHCADCHALGGRGRRDKDDDYMGGSENAFEYPKLGKAWAPNLTPDEETGLGKSTAEQIKGALREGKRLDGQPMFPPMSLFIPHLSGVTDEDLDALMVWLKALPPVKHQVPPRELTEAGKSYLGMAQTP